MNKALGGALIVVLAIVMMAAAWIVIHNTSKPPAPESAGPIAGELQAAPEPAARQLDPSPQVSAPEPAPAPAEEAEAAPSTAPPVTAPLRSIADGPIQAEDYDKGGEGAGYHDTSPGNTYGNYRQDDVDIETFSPGSFSIGSIAPGEWLAYTVHVPETGTYDLELNTATPRTGNQIQILVDNKQAADSITVPTTSGWGDFQTFAAPDAIRLEAGARTIKLLFPQGFVNIDWFQFHRLETGWPPAGVVAVRTVWDLTNQAAEGTTVTLLGPGGEGRGRWRSTGVTDANGEIALEFPAFAKSAQINARHPYSTLKTIDGIAIPPGQPIVVRLERVTTLFGTVAFSGDGKPAAGATIEALGSGKSVTATEDGSWEIVGLQSKSIRLIASKDDLVSYKDASEIPTVYLTAGAPNGPHNLILKPGPMLTGRVTDEETGQGIAGAKLSARLLSSDIAKTHEAASGEDGRYKIPGLWGDRYNMQIKSEDYVPADIIMALGSETRVERNFALEPGGIIHVAVKDTLGQPVKDAEFSVIMDNVWNSAGVQTDENGRADIKQISRKNPPAVVARHDDYKQSERKTIEFVDGARETELAFELTRSEKSDDADQTPKFFVGRVIDMESNPIDGAVIRWGQRWNLETAADRTETDAGGHYRLEAKRLNYGGMILAVTADGFAPAWKTDTLPGPEDNPNEVNFTLEPAHWLEVTVVDEEKDPIPGASVGLQASTTDNYGWTNIPGLNSNYTANEQGQVRLEGLPGPTVLLSASKEGYSRHNGEPAAVDSEVTIVLKPAAMILGRLLDKDTKTPISEFNVKISGNVTDYDRTRKGESISDPDGRFKITDLTIDEAYLLTFSADGYPPSNEQGVTAVREEIAKEQTFYITKGTGLTIEIVSSEDAETPIAGATILAALRNPQAGNYRHVQWDSIANDTWMWKATQTKTTNELGHVTFEEGSEKFTLFIKAEGRQRLIVEPSARSGYHIDDFSRLRVPLQPESAIEGIYSLKGQAQSGASISLSRSGNNMNENFGMSKTTAEGRFEFTGIGPGEHQLGVMKTENNRGYTTMQKRVTLKTAERKTVVLGEDLGPYTLSGKITRDGQPLSGASINARPKFSWEYTFLGGQSAEDGVYRVEGLQPGTYIVHVSWHNMMGGGDYLNRSETIAISGDMEKDFDFGGSFKVVATLKFPEAMPVEMRAQYRGATLQYIGDWNELNRQGLDGNKNINFMGNQLEFKGRFKGKYNLSLMYTLPGGSGALMPIPRSPFDIDNTEQDVDLGELEVPMPGGVKMELVFARPENRDLYNNIAIQTTIQNYYHAPNPEGITFSSNAPLGENPITFPGRFKGEYRISVSNNQGNIQNSVSVPETYTIANPDVETDLGQVVVPPIYDIIGRLIIPDDQQGKYTSIMIRTGKIEDMQGNNPDGLTQMASSVIGPDGSFKVTGRFRGDYVIVLLGAGQNPWGDGFSLSQNFALNNLDGDQDLGDIELGGSGMVKIVLVHTDPDKQPEHVIGFIMDESDGVMRGQFQIDQNQPEQEIGPFPAGAITLQFLSPGFRIDPGRVTVTVDPDVTPQVTLSMSPEGMIMGEITASAQTEQALKVDRITLEGPGVSRELVPMEGGSLSDLLINWSDGQDAAVSIQRSVYFMFRNLPEGEFTVRVEAPGYEPAESKQNVVPGQASGGEMDIRLTPVAASEAVE